MCELQFSLERFAYPLCRLTSYPGSSALSGQWTLLALIYITSVAGIRWLTSCSVCTPNLMHMCDALPTFWGIELRALEYCGFSLRGPSLSVLSFLIASLWNRSEDGVLGLYGPLIISRASNHAQWTPILKTIIDIMALSYEIDAQAVAMDDLGHSSDSSVFGVCECSQPKCTFVTINRLRFHIGCPMSTSRQTPLISYWYCKRNRKSSAWSNHSLFN